MKTITIILCLLTTNAFSATAKKQKQNHEPKTLVSTNTENHQTPSEPSFKNYFTGGHSFLNEFLVNYSSAGFSNQKACSNCDSDTTIEIQASYLHYIKDNIQAGIEAGITSANDTNFNFTGVAQYNFESDLKNSPFIKFGLGLVSVAGANSSGTDAKFGLFLGGGKRFPIFNNVTYSPELRIVKKGDLDVGFEANILNISLYWN